MYQEKPDGIQNGKSTMQLHHSSEQVMFQELSSLFEKKVQTEMNLITVHLHLLVIQIIVIIIIII